MNISRLFEINDFQVNNAALSHTARFGGQTKGANMRLHNDSTIEKNTGRTESILRVLLVDDELQVWWQQHLAMLAARGYHVDTAEDGEEAWKALQRHDYDLLITDNKMPTLCGLGLIERIRKHGMRLPIIFASSVLPTIDPQQRGYFHDVFLAEKPLSPAHLLSIIQTFQTGSRDSLHSTHQRSSHGNSDSPNPQLTPRE